MLLCLKHMQVADAGLQVINPSIPFGQKPLITLQVKRSNKEITGTKPTTVGQEEKKKQRRQRGNGRKRS